MPYLILRVKVAEFSQPLWLKWVTVRDKGGTNRQMPEGFRGEQLFRNASDPSEVLILQEWDQLDQAHQFVQSTELQQELNLLGSTQQPIIYFPDKVKDVPA